MERITPEQVVEAYKETGLKPVRGHYWANGGTCACAIGAMSAKSGTDVYELERRIGRKDGYVKWFICGFDGDELNSHEPNDAFAYADGQAAWQACIDAGLVTVSE